MLLLLLPPHKIQKSSFQVLFSPYRTPARLVELCEKADTKKMITLMQLTEATQFAQSSISRRQI